MSEETARIRAYMATTSLGGNHPTVVVVPRADLEKVLEKADRYEDLCDE